MIVFFTSACIFSITQIIAESKLFSDVREFFMRNLTFLYNLTSCFLCTSVWVSFFVALILPVARFEHGLFFDTMFYSCMVWFMRLFETYLTKQ